MKSRRFGLILAIGAVGLLVGALVAGLWPVKSDTGVSCGSFLSASSSVYNDAYQRRVSVVDDLKSKLTESDRKLIEGIQILAGEDPEDNLRETANLAVAQCAERRQTGGIVAGVLLVLSFVVGGLTAYLIGRGSGEIATA